MKTRAILLMAGLLIGGCKREAREKIIEGPIDPNSAVSSKISFKDFAMSLDYGDPNNLSVLMIKTERDWEQAWQAVSSGLTPVPMIDFDSCIVVAAIDKTHPSGGFDLEITEMELQPLNNKIVAHIKTTTPGTKCVVTAEITRPYHFLVVAGTEWIVVPDIAQETLICP